MQRECAAPGARSSRLSLETVCSTEAATKTKNEDQHLIFRPIYFLFVSG